ncbi:hypothetical protein B0H16DRAFT_1829167 [Mycena metata]|uniref:Uncharacterized protein n=1 Tax=Mycena metata TaxID=1033252 RepID=A0AAD7GSA2_9AGAR|nr:hypothetical protein B0H16DRAFT_1829167 [Mycena metata]
MPSLSSAPPSFSPSGILGLGIFVVGVPSLSAQCTLSASTSATIWLPDVYALLTPRNVALRPWSFPRPAPHVNAKKSVAAASLAAARAQLPKPVKHVVLAKNSLVRKSFEKIPSSASHFTVRQSKACQVPTRFGASRTRPRPGPSPLRATILAEDIVCAPVPVLATLSESRIKQATTIATLVTARLRLAASFKSGGDGINPSSPPVRKSMYTRLQQQYTAEFVSARFGITRNRTHPGPSPLRNVFTELQREPLVTSVSVTARPPIALALAELLASAYREYDTEAKSSFVIGEDDEADTSDFDIKPDSWRSSFHLNAACSTCTQPHHISLTPPVAMHTLIVQSPSSETISILGDSRRGNGAARNISSSSKCDEAHISEEWKENSVQSHLKVPSRRTRRLSAVSRRFARVVL